MFIVGLIVMTGAMLVLGACVVLTVASRFGAICHQKGRDAFGERASLVKRLSDGYGWYVSSEYAAANTAERSGKYLKNDQGPLPIESLVQSRLCLNWSAHTFSVQFAAFEKFEYLVCSQRKIFAH
jgi:hypothetical protein